MTPTPRTELEIDLSRMTGERDQWKFNHDMQVELLAGMTAQRDMWKANHDNQVRLKQILTDRPDLSERSKLVQELMEKLANMTTQRDELQNELTKALMTVLKLTPRTSEWNGGMTL